VRGTEFGIRLQPNSSTILNLEGALQVGNIFPEVGQQFQRAFKVAFAFGPGHGGNHHWVLLNKLQGTTVAAGLPPTLAFNFSKKDWEGFLQQMAVGVPVSWQSDGITGAGIASGTTGGNGGAAAPPDAALGLQGPSNPIVTIVPTLLPSSLLPPPAPSKGPPSGPPRLP